MGTVATVEIHEPVPRDDLLDEAFAWLHEVDQRFSTYRSDSEVCRLDRGELRIEDCSDDLRFVLAECTRLWQETDGYFDAYAKGGLDPSGYVKGWAVQVASDRLLQAGAPNHLVDAGGDLQTRGRPAPGELWQIGIRHPWEKASVAWVLEGTDLAVATSGTYERGFHVVDPRTGDLAKGLRSVTVVGRDLADADAYATAAVAMGQRALTWLATLSKTGFGSAVICEDRTAYVSAGLPIRSAVVDSGALDQAGPGPTSAGSSAPDLDQPVG
jgi:thiamine biosynthesis lipoprotein